MTKLDAYAKYFDDFIALHKLDEDCTTWPAGYESMLDAGWAQRSISTAKAITKFVPNKTDMELALLRLEILPETDGLVEVPWRCTETPEFDPVVWDNAVLEVVKLADLTATSPRLKVKKVRKHIEAMGQALKPYRSYALVAEKGGVMIIIDGHHRLMSQWLLGLDSAPVWKVVL